MLHLHRQLAREQSLPPRLHPDALAAVQWQGQQAGLPVALWPLLAATDARLPPPAPAWRWEDAARLPAGSGWPVQLLPGYPPLEAWLWPQGAEVISGDGATPLLDRPEGVAALRAYGGAFGPAGQGMLSPLPGAGTTLGGVSSFIGQRIADCGCGSALETMAAQYTRWATQAQTLRAQQVAQRRVDAWFPTDEWPPVGTGAHRWQDRVGPLHRPAPPGAHQTGLPTVAYGLGLRADAAQPDLLYQTARALQEAAPAFLAYSPFQVDRTAHGLRQRWGHLDDTQAAALAAALQLRVRPVWGVPRVRPFWQFGYPPDVADPLPAIRYWELHAGILEQTGGNDFSAYLEELIRSLSLVVALGILPAKQAAIRAAQALHVLLPLISKPA